MKVLLVDNPTLLVSLIICSNKMSWRRTTETSWQRSTETSLGVSLETYLRHRWDVQRYVVTTSLRHVVAGWERFGKTEDLF